MDDTTPNTQMLPLLEAFKPYMGTKGQGVIETVTDLSKLFNSESVQDILRRLYRISPMINKEAKAVRVNTQSGRMEFSSGSFVLLLALVLLLFTSQSE